MSRPERHAWIAAVVLLAACMAGWLLAPARLPFAWLAAYTGFSLWPLGSLALLFAHALTGGRWGEALRPGLLLGASATLLLPVLAIPVLLSLPTLYEWARPEGATLPNRFWLNPTFFAVRGTIDLLVWVGLALRVLRGGNVVRLAPFALLALMLTVTFAAIDLTMSLNPRFVSSAYGMIAAAAAVTAALALAIPLSPAPDAHTSDAIGRLLLAFCALWTYLDFMQVLIVWQNDLVAATPWYLARTAGPWGWVMAAVAVAHGVGPIGALLLPAVRRSRRGLTAVAGTVLAAELVRSWWTVLPPRLPGLLDLCCMGFMGAAGSLWVIRRRHHA